MHAEFVELAAGHGGFPCAPVIGLPKQGVRETLHDHDGGHVAEFAGREHGFHFLDPARVPPLVADREHAASFLADLQHLLGLGERGGDGLLDQHVLAGAEGRQGLRVVEKMGRRQHDRFDPGIG